MTGRVLYKEERQGPQRIPQSLVPETIKIHQTIWGERACSSEWVCEKGKTETGTW